MYVNIGSNVQNLVLLHSGYIFVFPHNKYTALIFAQNFAHDDRPVIKNISAPIRFGTNIAFSGSHYHKCIQATVSPNVLYVLIGITAF